MAQLSLGYLLGDVLRLVRARFQNDPDIGCITLSQAKALWFISMNEGVKQVELAELLDLKPMTVAKLIDQLVDEGLVERCPSPTDRRAYLIHLLPPAQAQLDLSSLVRDRIWQDGLKGLNEQEVQQFISTLKLIHSNLSPSPEKPDQKE